MIKQLDKILRVSGNSEILNSRAYGEIVCCLTYFFGFIDDSRVPNIFEMIEKMISNHLKDIENPYARFVSGIFNAPKISLAIGSGEAGTPIVIVSARATSGLSIRCGLDGQKTFTGPMIHINPAGYNTNGWRKLRIKGALIQGYNLPREIAKVILNKFDKLEGDSRKNIILKLAKSDDAVECSDWRHNYCLQEYKTDNNVSPGIDSSKVWILNDAGSELSVFGNIHGHTSGPEVFLSLRVERDGREFKFSKEDCWLDD